MTTFAHAGHWLVQAAYVAPLGVLAMAVAVGKLRERRRLRAAQDRGTPSGR